MATMKAVRMHAFGDVDVLHYEEVERPEPQAGEVLVRVRAAGINPVDWGARSYPMPSTTGAAGAGLPYILGWDLAGSVVALGAGGTHFAIGDAVYGMPRFPGQAKAYSEYTAAPISDLARKPEQLTHQQAAAVPMSALTAWQALFDTAGLQAGQTVFIPGGAGGVGHLAIQLAKWKDVSMLDLTNPKHAHVDERLRKNHILWLGTVRPDGRPHLVYVFFLWDGKHILIFSQPTSQKLRNVQHNPHVTLGLDETKDGEDMVILEGKAELLHDPAVNATLPAYAAKYDSLLKRVGLTAAAMAAIYSQALLITPTRFFHRQGTRGQRVEVIA